MTFLEELNITVGTYNILKKNGFTNLDDIIILSEDEVSNLDYMTNESFFEIIEVLNSYKEESWM